MLSFPPSFLLLLTLKDFCLVKYAKLDALRSSGCGWDETPGAKVVTTDVQDRGMIMEKWLLLSAQKHNIWTL